MTTWYLCPWWASCYTGSDQFIWRQHRREEPAGGKPSFEGKFEGISEISRWEWETADPGQLSQHHQSQQSQQILCEEEDQQEEHLQPGQVPPRLRSQDGWLQDDDHWQHRHVGSQGQEVPPPGWDWSRHAPQENVEEMFLIFVILGIFSMFWFLFSSLNTFRQDLSVRRRWPRRWTSLSVARMCWWRWTREHWRSREADCRVRLRRRPLSTSTPRLLPPCLHHQPWLPTFPWRWDEKGSRPWWRGRPGTVATGRRKSKPGEQHWGKRELRPYLLPLFLSIYRKVDSKEATERKKAVQEMNEGELLTALREKLKNIEAAGEI